MDSAVSTGQPESIHMPEIAGILAFIGKPAAQCFTSFRMAISKVQEVTSMSPLEAKKIIESLAHGVDPETGEILPTQNSFNSPQVIRALFVASEALDSAVKRAERNSSLPGNAGHSWSDDEDKELLALFDSGTLVKEIAAKHGRTQGAIVSRLIRLGRIKDRAEVYANTQRGISPATTHHQEGTQ